MARVDRTVDTSGEGAYRIRTAGPEDSKVLRRAAGTTISHPDPKGHRASFAAAAARGELLLLERYDNRTHNWEACAFVDWHIRVDDVLTIRDVGTEGETPQSTMVKQLFLELIRSLNPVEASVKSRSDATNWNSVIEELGFTLEGTEYRRPHWFSIWHWTPPARGAVQRRPASGGRRFGRF